MLYTRVAAVSPLALMALSSGYVHLQGVAVLCVLASWICGFGKVMWLRKQPDLAAAA